MRGIPYTYILVAAVLALAFTVVVFLAQPPTFTPSKPITDQPSSVEPAILEQDNPSSLNLAVCYAIDNYLLLEVELAPEFEGESYQTVTIRPYFYGILVDGELYLRGYRVERKQGLFGPVWDLFPTLGGTLPMVTYPVRRVLSVQALQNAEFEPDGYHRQQALEGTVTPFCQLEMP